MTKQRWFLLVGLVVFLVSAGWFVSEPVGLKTSVDGLLAQGQQSGSESKKIVPFVPTPQEVVERMLELASTEQRRRGL